MCIFLMAAAMCMCMCCAILYGIYCQWCPGLLVVYRALQLLVDQFLLCMPRFIPKGYCVLWLMLANTAHLSKGPPRRAMNGPVLPELS